MFALALGYRVMARKLKPYKVDQVVNQTTGIKVDIMLDREDKTFFGMVGESRIGAQTAKECMGKVRELLKDFTGMVWEPYIVVSSSGGSSHHTYDGHQSENASVQLVFHRLLGAETVEKTWVQLPFEEDAPGGSYHFGPDHYTERWWRGKDTSVAIIPYTEEAWSTLGMMRDRINDIAAFLEKLVGRKDFEKLLNNPKGNLLLGAPKPTKRKTKN